jgi:hypothetical protein
VAHGLRDWTLGGEEVTVLIYWNAPEPFQSGYVSDEVDNRHPFEEDVIIEPTEPIPDPGALAETEGK